MSLNGIICPSLTITDDSGAFDFETWGQHLDHLAAAGVDGILLFGTLGEFFAFSLADKERAVDFAIQRIAGRTRVLVGVGGTIFPEVLAFTRFCNERKVDAVVAISPYYFGLSDGAALEYFGAIASAIDKPIVLYNFPARTGSDLSPQLVTRLAQRYGNIAAIKDTVDTISHTRRVIAAVRAVRPDFSVLSGYDEYYLVNRISGGAGVLCGLTNVEPEVFVAMHHAYEAGNLQLAIRCAQRISHLMSLYDVADLFISALKGAVRIRGLHGVATNIQRPAVQLSSGQYEQIRAILAGGPQVPEIGLPALPEHD